MKAVEMVDKGKITGKLGGESCQVREIVWCDHLRIVPDPCLSTTPNVGLKNIPYAVLVVEELKIKLVCLSCLTIGARGHVIT